MLGETTAISTNALLRLAITPFKQVADERVKQLETLAIPADQGLGFDDDQSLCVDLVQESRKEFLRLARSVNPSERALRLGR
jgi:hypothetical protein